MKSNQSTNGVSNMPTFRRIIRNWMLSALLLASCSGAPDRLAIDRLKPCSAAEGPTDGYCGKLEVWEDRQARSGRKIALKIGLLLPVQQEPDRQRHLAAAGCPPREGDVALGQRAGDCRLSARRRDLVTSA